MKMKSKLEAFTRGVLAGMAAPVFLFAPEIILERSSVSLDAEKSRNGDGDVDRLRSDWERIGEDFRRVMAREAGDAFRG
ncbi:MAG: hypothetical protein LBS70_00335 [Candidatus Accumulibacter sp.]|jgi:hypothetical protein|nr:hypothetical protein [Accumulibacter sp.]